jgi:hypothetical protein
VRENLSSWYRRRPKKTSRRVLRAPNFRCYSKPILQSRQISVFGWQAAWLNPCGQEDSSRVFVAAMTASVAKEPFDSPDWIFETKLDGYRAIAVIDSAGRARIWSRNHLPLEQKFPTIQKAADKLNLRSTILDGEIVALDEYGIPRFQLLQQWQKRPTAPVVFYLFDLLWSDGRDITRKTVIQRRERLEQIVVPVSGIQVGGYIEDHGTDLFLLAKEVVPLKFGHFVKHETSVRTTIFPVKTEKNNRNPCCAKERQGRVDYEETVL